MITDSMFLAPIHIHIFSEFWGMVLRMIQANDRCVMSPVAAMYECPCASFRFFFSIFVLKCDKKDVLC